MVFDGRRYQGAPLITPYVAHSRAPVTGDLAAGPLVSAYFAAQHHAVSLGDQTYLRRHRRGGSDGSASGSAGAPFAIARFLDVYLPAHATHVGGVGWVARAPGGQVASLNVRARVVPNTGSTDTGTWTVYPLEDSRAIDAGRSRAHRFACEVPLTFSRPIRATVWIEAYAEDETATAVRVVPLMAGAWRFTAP